MRRIIIAGIAASFLTIPSVAAADQPDGSFVFKGNATYDQGNLVGRYSSQITQNGQFVGGNKFAGIDQTTTPGSRADAVQALLGH